MQHGERGELGSHAPTSAIAAGGAHVAKPTATDLRAWAYSGADEPVEDFDIFLDAVDVLPVVIECAADTGCPAQSFMLRSLYCTVGHLQAVNRPRIWAAAEDARRSPDASLRTWATRTIDIIDGIREMNQAEWCGWPSRANTNPLDVNL